MGSGDLARTKLKKEKTRRKQSGQAVVEYILLLAIVLGMVTLFIGKLTGSFDVATLNLGGKMEKQLRSGKAPASVWKK